MISAPYGLDEIVEGDRLDLDVGPVAPGGHCVARIGGPGGRVVFVRHALPGEQVVAEVTEVHRAFLRADAVRVLRAAADRVEPPCPYARPGRCGGCDLQHVAVSAQPEWKAAVVREQLQRLAGLTEAEITALGVRVEPLPGGPLGWRTRVRYTVDGAGRAGLLEHRSHRVVPIDRCRIAHPVVQELPVTGQSWPDADAVEVVASSRGDISVVTRSTGSAPGPDGADLGRPDPGGDLGADAGSDLSGGARTLPRGSAEVRERAAGRDWIVPVDGFWQVHPSAADTLVAAVVELLRPVPGETAWDLYGGTGLFAAALAARTGAPVALVESSRVAAAAARANLADLGTVRVHYAPVEAVLRGRRLAGPVDLVVLDPPRSGAGARVVRAIAAAGPRAVAYVACDPASLGRDIATFRAAGWRLAALRAYDCFPMTQHVECVALLTPAGR